MNIDILLEQASTIVEQAMEQHRFQQANEHYHTAIDQMQSAERLRMLAEASWMLAAKLEQDAREGIDYGVIARALPESLRRIA